MWVRFCSVGLVGFTTVFEFVVFCFIFFFVLFCFRVGAECRLGFVLLLGRVVRV